MKSIESGGSIPRQSVSGGPVCLWNFSKAPQAVSDVVVPLHAERGKVGVQLVRMCRTAQHHVNPGLSQHGSDSQCVDCGAMAAGHFFEQAALGAEGGVLV